MKANAGLSVPALLFVTAACAPPLMARPVPFRNYDRMAKEADVIVIAGATAARDTAERLDLPGFSPPVTAVGVETAFTVAALLKGDLACRNVSGGKTGFVLHRLRLQKPAALPENGPGLVHFSPGSRAQYLMFLEREPDGRYRALSGQTDPGLFIEGLKWQR